MTKQDKSTGLADKLREMRKDGVEHTLPSSGRSVRLRTVEPAALLREEKGNVPDILTPLLINSIYEEPSDEELARFLATRSTRAEDALAMIDAVDIVVKKSLADDTKLEELSFAEKRWIFRLALSPAELLVTFRFEPRGDVGSVDAGEAVPPKAK